MRGEAVAGEAGQALVQVLAGRDPAPAWRSAAARRRAVAVAWLGWAALSLAALAVKFVAFPTDQARRGPDGSRSRPRWRWRSRWHRGTRCSPGGWPTSAR